MTLFKQHLYLTLVTVKHVFSRLRLPDPPGPRVGGGLPPIGQQSDRDPRSRAADHLVKEEGRHLHQDGPAAGDRSSSSKLQAIDTNKK